jgi:hypothetical protein
LLDKDEHETAIDLILETFNEDEIGLITNKSPFFAALKRKDRIAIAALLEDKLKFNFLERLFSVKQNAYHTVVSVLGVRFKIKYS